jgi:AraC-like DNA-binding protein
MRPTFLKKNTKTFERSFFVNHAIVPHFYDVWHFHQELELNYVLRGKGTRFVGDHIEGFSDGDMVLVGANLPHVWRNDKAYYQGDGELFSEAIIFQFLENFAGNEFFILPELQQIDQLFQLARRGIKIQGKTRDQVGKKMQTLLHLNSGERFIELISILNLIAYSGELQPLSSTGFLQTLEKVNNERINQVYEYVMNHFLEDISLEKAAQIANMNVAAFCRFFKTTTKKTFVQFLTDIRIGYACKLLQDTNMNINQVCYESGFNNISHFNRKFRQFTAKTPQEYRCDHLRLATGTKV